MLQMHLKSDGVATIFHAFLVVMTHLLLKNVHLSPMPLSISPFRGQAKSVLFLAVIISLAGTKWGVILTTSVALMCLFFQVNICLFLHPSNSGGKQICLWREAPIEVTFAGAQEWRATKTLYTVPNTHCAIQNVLSRLCFPTEVIQFSCLFFILFLCLYKNAFIVWFESLNCLNGKLFW